MFRLTPKIAVLIWVSVLGACTVSCSAPVTEACLPSTTHAHPTNLACTGLYADVVGDTLSPDVSPYAPSTPLWADGASKRRFIYLPPGTTIDSRDPDHWLFPNGTKIWKEFSRDGRKLETRYLEKQSDGSRG